LDGDVGRGERQRAEVGGRRSAKEAWGKEQRSDEREKKSQVLTRFPISLGNSIFNTQYSIFNIQ
jgi:hypothetical protein